MMYAVEAWTFPTPDDEEPCETDMVESMEFDDESEAMRWAWRRMEEGFATKMWRR